MDYCLSLLKVLVVNLDFSIILIIVMVYGCSGFGFVIFVLSMVVISVNFIVFSI